VIAGSGLPFPLREALIDFVHHNRFRGTRCEPFQQYTLAAFVIALLGAWRVFQRVLNKPTE
jgi:hypothetical protein